MKRLLLLALVICSPSFAAPALLTHTSQVGTGTGNATVTSSINTTGATLLTVCVVSHTQSPTITVTDSLSNTWYLAGLQATLGGANNSWIYYSPNPTTGASDAVTVTGTMPIFGPVGFDSWSGITSPYPDVFAVATGGTTVQPGATTPNDNNELGLACGTSSNNNVTGNTISISGSSFNSLDNVVGINSVSWPMGSAYVIQTTASSANPTLSATSGSPTAVVMVFFTAGLTQPTKISRQIAIQHTKVGQINSTTQTNFVTLFDPTRADLLGAAITTTNATSITLTAGLQILPQDVIQIDSEQIMCRTVAGTALSACSRGYNHTTPATHLINASVGDYAYLALVANGGVVTSSSGYDIVFGTSVGCGTPLTFERVFWTSTTGKSEWWFQKTASNSVNTAVYLCAGNSAITTDQSNAAATWPSQYKRVFHMQTGVGGTSTVLVDSTGTANGTGSSSLPAASAAWINNGYSGLNNSEWVDIGTLSNIFNGSNTVLALSFWFSRNQGAVSASAVAGPASGQFSGSLMYSYVGDSSAGSTALLYATAAGSNYKYVGMAGNWGGFPNWYYATMVLDLTNSSNCAIYINGLAQAGVSCVTNGTVPTTLNALSNHSFLFIEQTDGFSGQLDEVHYATAAPTADWVNTEYNNQFAPYSFYAMSTAVNTNAPPVVF